MLPISKQQRSQRCAAWFVRSARGLCRTLHIPVLNEALEAAKAYSEVTLV